MSLSQSLAKKLGGKISVKSEYGKNCIFISELPIIKNKVVAEDESKHLEMDELKIEGLMDCEEQTILIVEDNEELRSFRKECLTEKYNILEVENGLDVLEVLENNMVNIIISDILMPKMNSLVLCDEVKNNPAHSHLPFILFSAKTDTLTKINGLKKGADEYV